MSSNNTSIQLENPGLTPFNYQCRGTDILLPNNIHAYFVTTSSLAPASMGIVIVHDVFGFKINKTRRFADILAAKANANVLMPDFFQDGDPWPLEDFPPQDQGHFSKWLKKVSDWNYITQVLSTSNNYLKTLLSEDHRNSLGILGFSWGGKQVMRACSSKDYGYLAGVSIDGYMLEAEDAEKLNIPVFFMPSGDNKSVDIIKNILKKRPFGDRCRYFTFVDESHGFASALGDLNNQHTLEAVNHTLTLSSAFFIENARDAEKAEKEKMERTISKETAGSKELIGSGLNIARSS
ncbi:unnamed protein product [Hymenolepis diminuta]|uniref:Dienelactone hydrolase domain-containing protein n=1 Tax=Hymenolepis diminuta TaxID=6216 RepID=A0A564YAQ9_HYMDI|nr:unnamed protein product [Hymenolepis diminuta]